MDVKIIRTSRKRRGQVSGFIFEVRKHILMLIMFFLLFIGLLSGNFMVSGNSNIFDSVGTLFSTYIHSLEGQTFLRHFLHTVAINIGIITVNLLFGLCAVGFPVSLVSIIIKGLSIGAFSSYMYSAFALKGFGYCMLVIFPIQIIACLILMKVCHESITMSVSILKILTERKQSGTADADLHRYILRFIVLIVLSVLLSLISSVTSLYVTKLFNF